MEGRIDSPMLSAVLHGPLKAVPGFLACLTIVFFASKKAYKRCRLKPEDRAMLASCTVSLLHGIPAAIIAAKQIAHAWPLNISSPNTEANQLLLQYTLAYMISDTVYYLLPYTPTDFLFCAHHVVVIIYVATAILHERGALSCIFMLLFGECTSLWQNSWYITTTLKGRKRWLDAYRRFLSFMYPASYIVARSIVGPPCVLWLCRELHDSKTISLPLRNTWITICLVSLAGSQLWSVGLAKTWMKGDTGPVQLANKLD